MSNAKNVKYVFSHQTLTRAVSVCGVKSLAHHFVNFLKYTNKVVIESIIYIDEYYDLNVKKLNWKCCIIANHLHTFSVLFTNDVMFTSVPPIHA